MDALIRVMVGAVALCAASIACAGPVVVDGDPDEPDVGAGVLIVESVTPHRAFLPYLRLPEKTKTQLKTTTTATNDDVRAFQVTSSYIYIKCHTQSSRFIEQTNDTRLLGESDFVMTIDLQNRVVTRSDEENFRVKLDEINNNIISFYDTQINRNTGKYYRLSARGGISLEEHGKCGPTDRPSSKLF